MDGLSVIGFCFLFIFLLLMNTFTLMELSFSI